jgi:N-acetylmuramic acid 6-phosphate etherase
MGSDPTFKLTEAFGAQPLLDGVRGAVVLEVEEHPLDAPVCAEHLPELGVVMGDALELRAPFAHLRLFHEQATVFVLALRRARRDPPEPLRLARRWRIERDVDDVAGLDVEVMRERDTEVGNLQPVEVDHGPNDIVRRELMSQDRLEASLDIDLRPAIDIVRIIQEQDAVVAGAVAAQAERIAHAIDEITERMRHGGRLFYAGAGTSGRIAMLDASELPPTYGIAPDLVRVLIAGGERAYFEAVEGAEDDEEAAIETVNREVRADDAIVGIAASGTTPYTVAAVRRANMLGALTIGVTNVPGSPLAQHVDIPIVIQTGPEVIMGSTRMKSGTAQKLVLNQLSTGVMIRLGRVYSNLMIDMPATNEKLRNRAVRMVELAAGVPRPQAVQAIREADGNVKLATVIAKKRIGADEARELLGARPLREVLE